MGYCVCALPNWLTPCNSSLVLLIVFRFVEEKLKALIVGKYSLFLRNQIVTEEINVVRLLFLDKGTVVAIFSKKITLSCSLFVIFGL